jgi:hypothetical protein
MTLAPPRMGGVFLIAGGRAASIITSAPLPAKLQASLMGEYMSVSLLIDLEDAA